MIEVRKTLLAPFCEGNVRLARRMFNHCPDCGGHTRIMVIRGLPGDEGPVQGPPQALLFYCDRCTLALLAVYDPTHEVALEQGLREILRSAGLLPAEA